MIVSKECPQRPFDRPSIPARMPYVLGTLLAVFSLLVPTPGIPQPGSSSSCKPTTPQKPLDLVGDQVDCIWHSPGWNFEVQKGTPPDVIKGLCKGSKKCNPQVFTSQSTEKNEGRCLVPSRDIGTEQWSPLIECGCWPSDASVHGHVNWGIATYDGMLYWQEWSYWDGDYDFLLVPRMHRGLTQGNDKVGDDKAIGVEFDAWETLRGRRRIEVGKDSIWADLRDAVAARPPVRWGAMPAVVTGRFGLDCGHGCHSELHPVYVLAVRYGTVLEDDEAADRWAIMVRNFGNEGDCSDQQDHPITPGIASLSLYLRHPASPGSAEPDPNARYDQQKAPVASFAARRGGSPTTPIRESYRFDGDTGPGGVTLTFTLQNGLPNESYLEIGEVKIYFKTKGKHPVTAEGVAGRLKDFGEKRFNPSSLSVSTVEEEDLSDLAKMAYQAKLSALATFGVETEKSTVLRAVRLNMCNFLKTNRKVPERVYGALCQALMSGNHRP